MTEQEAMDVIVREVPTPGSEPTLGEMLQQAEVARVVSVNILICCSIIAVVFVMCIIQHSLHFVNLIVYFFLHLENFYIWFMNIGQNVFHY